MRLFDRAIFLLAKSSGYLIKRLGRGGGSAFPGLLAERLDRRLLTILCSQLSGVIVVCGTNGKTTTSRLIATLLEKPGQAVVHNRSGSNLIRGILSALIQQATWKMQLPHVWGIFEVDEAVLPKLITLVPPKILVATNLFRDQLDRYGEVDSIANAWRQAIVKLPESTTIILNADDPLVASLAHSDRVRTFGIEGTKPAPLPSYADSRRCPVCQEALVFDSISYSHLGIYHCPNDDFSRPQPDLKADKIVLHGMHGSSFTLQTSDQSIEGAFGLAGVYNIYNALAATLVGLQIGLNLDTLQKRIAAFESVFGRLEEVHLGDSVLTLILVKNPTGFNQVIQTLRSEENAESFWFVLNDRYADGRDISWIWDVEVEELVPQMRHGLVSGSRALDMALRLKYAGVNPEDMRILPPLANGLRTISTMKRGNVYCLCTYTAMLELRQLLTKQRKVQPFYKD